MNFITEEFINYIESKPMSESVLQSRGIERACVIAIFNESEKRGIDESEKGLLFNAVLTLVKYEENAFNNHLAKLYGRCNPLQDEDCKTIANEISEMMSKNKTFKGIVESYLWTIQKHTFENELANYFGETLVKAYPMTAFGFCLDYIENYNDLPEYLNREELIKSLKILLRVGNAVLPYHERNVNDLVEMRERLKNKAI